MFRDIMPDIYTLGIRSSDAPWEYISGMSHEHPLRGYNSGVGLEVTP